MAARDAHLADALLDVLETALSEATVLRDALERECRALTRIDADELALAGERKHAALEVLDRLEQQRRTLCASGGVEADADGMDALLARYDASGEIAEHWKALIATLGDCRRANAENGTLVASQRRQVLEALNVLRGSGQALYGRHGIDRPNVTGQTLAEA